MSDSKADYDVVVAGGGVAGAAAALAAARSGARTALVEKTILLGGLATGGLVNIYLPLCDGRGTQVLFGIAEEFFHLAIRYGPGEIPPGWRETAGARTERFATQFNPASFALALDEALEEAGVDLWLDTLACQPILEGRRVVGVEAENKSGRLALRAGCVVDATGDADLAFRAGAPCVEGVNWLSLWAIEASIEKAQATLAEGTGAGLLNVVRLGGDDSGRGAPDAERWRGISGRAASQFALASRRLLRERYRRLYAERGPAERRNVFPLTLPSVAQFRMTRRIEGVATIEEGQHGVHVADSVGLVPDWRRVGEVWEVPFGALIPKAVGGLVVAGRCISSAGDAWQVMRVIPPAAHTGQVAGLAAALAAERGAPPGELEIAGLQRKLRDLGIPLHHEDLGLEARR